MVCGIMCYGYILAAIAISLYFIRKYVEGGQFTKNVCADGKVIIITGCNTGIGKETALELARRGGHVYMACRNIGKCEQARNQIIDLTGNTNVFSMPLDLTSMESVRNFVKKFLQKETSLHVLINNAGVYGLPRTLTKDGHETVLAANHLGHFLLTNLLLDTLKSSAPSRVVTVASQMHNYGRIIKHDLHGERKYNMVRVYENSKLANVLFSRELAKRTKNTGVSSYSLHPGIVRTDIMRNSRLLFPMAKFVLFFLGKSLKSGAQTSIACSLDPDFRDISGKYFVDCKVAEESKAAQDDEMAEWLWNTSEKLTGLAN